MRSMAMLNSFFLIKAIIFFFYFVCLLGVPGLITCKILSVKEENALKMKMYFSFVIGTCDGCTQSPVMRMIPFV